MCYASVVITIVSLLALFIFVDSEEINRLLLSDLFIAIRAVLLLFLFILWIKSFIVWSKKDKKLVNFFLLFFLHGFYLLYYYRKIIKNGWL